MGWMILSLVALFSVRVSMSLWKVGYYLSKKKCRLLVSVALVPVMLILGTCAWLPFQLAYATTEDDDILPVIPFGLLVVAVLYLYRPANASLAMETPDDAPVEATDAESQSSASQCSTFSI